MFRSHHRKSRYGPHRWWYGLYPLLNAIYRKRPVWMVSFSISEASLSEGLRAACASTAMLALGDVLHSPAFAWAAIGAFWTCLADAAGSNRARFASMMGFALLSTLFGGVTAFAAGAGAWPAAIAVAGFTFVGGFGRVWGAASSQVYILAATACVVMVDHPLSDTRSGFAFLAIYLAGCLFAVALSLSIWRIHPFGPSRKSIRAVYVRLADVALDSARLLNRDASVRQWSTHAANFRADARAALERARNALARVPSSRGSGRGTYDNLLILLGEAESLFAYLIAVSGACANARTNLADRARAARVLTAMGSVLREIGEQAGDEPWVYPDHPQARLHRLAQRLERAFVEPVVLKSDAEIVDFAPTRQTAGSWLASGAKSLGDAWSTLKANLSVHSVGFRHAARVGVTTTAGFLLIRALGLPFGYWATMATLLILQPSVGATWPRSIERAAGSIVGGLLAAAIGLVIHSPLLISLAVFPLVMATMALRPVSYSLFVLFLTPTFVLVADFAAPGANGLAFAITRLGNNVLGCVLALFATFFLWPTRERVDSRAYLGSAVLANLAYLNAALDHTQRDDRELEQLRRAAGLGSNNAEEAVSRARLEKLEDSMVDTVTSTVLGLLRRMAGTATHLRLSAGRRVLGDELAAWVTAASAHVEACLNRSRAPVVLELPARERLSSLEAEAVGEIALLLRLLTERMREARG